MRGFHCCEAVPHQVPLHETVLLLPEDIIQVDAFIPQTWVYEPPLAIFADAGNSRKNPLDASLTSGSAIYIQNSPEFKFRQTSNACTYSYYDQDGSQEESSLKTAIGQSRQYRASQIFNGQILSNAVPNKTGTATPAVNGTIVSHPSAGVVVTEFEMNVSNPVAFGSSIAPIQCIVDVTIDRSDPGHPAYSISGTTCEFPAYEIYINNQQVYQYSPIPGGHGPGSLFLFDNTIDTTGALSQ